MPSSSQWRPGALDVEHRLVDRLPVSGTESEESGADLWDFLVTFVAARRTFLAIQRRYEERVVRAARASGVRREDLVLPPQELFELFNLRRLTFLKDALLGPLRDMAERIFAERSDEELLDVYCSHIYHEVSILQEEHRSVGRFVRIRDRRRYRQLFDEVSGYYPERLRRVKRLFAGSLRRIELLLPDWARYRVIVRCMYLFGGRLALHAYHADRAAIYTRMYPEGGEIRGYLEAARNFAASSFVTRAREAAQRGVDAAEHLASRRPLERAEERAASEVAEVLAQLDAEAGVRPSAS